MFRYRIIGTLNNRPKPVIIASTNYSDLADFITSHVCEALDPDGEKGLTVELVTCREADYYITYKKE